MIVLRSNVSEILVTREVILHDFKETLKVPESIVDEIIQDRINEKFHNDHVALTKELEAEGITMEEFKKKMRDEFVVEQMRIKYVPDRRRAEEILSQFKGGASFEELARSYSEGSQRLDGGETGWEDFSVLNKLLGDEINKSKPGECSGVIDAPDGFYLLLLEDRHPAHYQPLNDVREKIEKELAARETERLSRQWINRLKAKTFIKNY